MACAEHMMITKKTINGVNLFELMLQMLICRILQKHVAEPRVAECSFTRYEDRF